MRRLFTCLVLALLGLAALPGSAGANDIGVAGPPFNIVRMWPPNPPCNPAGTFITFSAATPFGTVPARYCTYQDTAIGGPPDNFKLDLDLTSISLGIVNLSGTPVCLTTSFHTAVQSDLIVTSSNPAVIPPGFRLFVRLVDNNFGSVPSQISGGPLADQAGVMVIPPGPPPTVCPFIPLPTNAVTSGSVGVH